MRRMRVMTTGRRFVASLAILCAATSPFVTIARVTTEDRTRVGSSRMTPDLP